MNINRTTLTGIISFMAILFALSFVSQLVDEVGPPILLDPEHKLEIPPPPRSMYQMGKDANTPPATEKDLIPPHSEKDSSLHLTPSGNDSPSRKQFLSLDTPNRPSEVSTRLSQTPREAGLTPRELYYTNDRDSESTPTLSHLGLRYSVLKTQPDGTLLEVHPDTIFSKTEKLSLTVEVNQSSYLYVLTTHPKKIWTVLFPADISSTHPDPVQQRTRQTINLSKLSLFDNNRQEVSITLFVSQDSKITPQSLWKDDEISSHNPPPTRHPAPKPGSKPMSPALRQTVLPTDSTVPPEYAVYVVEKPHAPSPALITTFTLSTQ